MPDLDRPDLDSLAARHGFPADAAGHLLDALVRSGGGQVQFDHPALGGLGQWHAGGMIMIGDMFNDALKARVAALCADLLPLAREAPRPSENVEETAWWPTALGSPASSGTQNEARYAVFPEARRLAVRSGGRTTLYDTGEYRIGGVSQRQGAGQDLSLTSQHGTVRLHDLAPIDPAGAAREPPGSPPHDIPALIERLGELRTGGHLTEAEFAAKKAELLGRL